MGGISRIVFEHDPEALLRGNNRLFLFQNVAELNRLTYANSIQTGFGMAIEATAFDVASSVTTIESES